MVREPELILQAGLTATPTARGIVCEGLRSISGEFAPGIGNASLTLRVCLTESAKVAFDWLMRVRCMRSVFPCVAFSNRRVTYCERKGFREGFGHGRCVCHPVEAVASQSYTGEWPHLRAQMRRQSTHRCRVSRWGGMLGIALLGTVP